MKRSFFLSTFLFAAVLSPVTLQPYTCGPPPEQARLAILELRVGSFAGENTIEGFNPNVFSYDVRFPESESVGVLWVKTNHPSTKVDVEYDGLPVRLRGQSVAELDVPLESSEITIHVTRPGTVPDAKTYVVHIERVPVFACTEQGIRDAITYGGGPNYFDCDGPTHVPTTAEIDIDNDVILDGEGNMIVDAGGGGGAGGAGGAGLVVDEVAPKTNGEHRVFSIREGVSAELIGFTVTGGATAGDGGGILNQGVFKLTSSTVKANSADRGGGIASLPPGTLTVVGSTVSDNTANLAAGLGTAGAAEVIDTTVSGNTALVAGGGLGVAAGGTLTVTSSIVQGNSAADGAGGVGSEADTTVTLNNTTISDNEAGNIGGGLQTGGTLTLNDSTVSQNAAVQANGGGIWNGDTGIVTLNNSTVSENTAGIFGGAVDNFGALTLVNSIVSGNVSRDGGGGLFNEAAGTLTVLNSTVSDNATTVGAGGGILHVSSQPVTITDGAVTGNESPDIGGGIAVGSGSELTMTNTTVSNNVAFNGGGIWASGPSSLTVLESTVSNNAASQGGGGITSFGDVIIASSSLISNQADFDGGMFVGGTATLTESTVAENEARFFTGGVGTGPGAELTMSDTMVVGNSASNGGGIGNGGTAIVSACVISDNSATERGGGIRNPGTMSVSNTTVASNSAGHEGGGVVTTGSLTLTDTVVSSNNSGADRDGGGILNSGTLTIVRSTISENTGGGCAIENYSGSIEIHSTTISGNTGGAIENPFPDGTLALINTTVSGNSRPGRGAIENAGTAVVIASTLLLDVADGTVLWDGRCLLDPTCPPGALTIRNTILYERCIGAPDVLSLGGNIEVHGDTCGLDHPTDQVFTPDPLLGPLADNGGPTRTHALLPDSWAIDQIPAAECVDADGAPLTTDQRGEPRPVAIHGPEPRCDVGAFEVQSGGTGGTGGTGGSGGTGGTGGTGGSGGSGGTGGTGGSGGSGGTGGTGGVGGMTGANPVITNIAWATVGACTQGTASDYTITITATDADNDPTDLMYIGDVPGCLGAIDGAVSTIICPNVAPFPGTVVAEDPGGNTSLPARFTIGVCETGDCETNPGACEL